MKQSVKPYWQKNDVLLAGQQALAKRAPSNKLLGYLKKYQQDLLTTDDPDGLPNFATQRSRLVQLMRDKYSEGQGFHQTIGGRNMNLPKFWELVLSMDFLSHEIELMNNIGYDNREVFAGLRSRVEAPYAEFVITSNALKREVATPLEAATPTTPPDIVPAPLPTLKFSAEPSSITSRSYDPDTGSLHFGGKEIVIIRQKSRRGKAVGETTQGGAMRKLFKSVNTLHDGVPLHTIISVRKENFDSQKRKRATNHLDEINRKIQEETGVPKLIIYDKVKYYIDKSYLKTV